MRPSGGQKRIRLSSFRLGEGFRCLAYREGNWLRLLSLHPGNEKDLRSFPWTGAFHF
jgi:hypothetical protein